MQRTREYIKTLFESGDWPTQQDFYDWLESTTWYDEAPVATTPNLDAVLTQGNSANGKKITNLLDPTAQQDAVTLAYQQSQQFRAGFVYSALGGSIIAEPLNGSILNLGALAVSLVDGTVRWVAVPVFKPATITGVRWYQTVIGSYTGDNYNGVGLWSYSAGNLTLVASSTNDLNIWQTFSNNTIGNKNFATPYAAAAGLYFVSTVYNNSAQTTAPGLGIYSQPPNAVTVTQDFTNSAKICGTLASQSGFVTPQAMSGLTASVSMPWFGLY